MDYQSCSDGSVMMPPLLYRYRHMLEDLRMRSKEENGLSDSAGTLISPSVALRAKQMQVLDLERNIMQVCA